jgi:hypothetical protein
MEAVNELLDAYGRAGVELIRQVVPKATGKTAQSIEYEVYPNRLVIYARAFFTALETGRGPRKSDEYQGFDKSLLEWMKAKGIGGELNEKKQKQLARFLSYKINQRGDRTFRSGGKTVYSQVVDKFIQELSDEVIKMMTKEYTDKYVNDLQAAVNGTISN